MRVIIRVEKDTIISDSIKNHVKQKLLELKESITPDGELILTFSKNEEGLLFSLEADFIGGRRKYTNKLNVVSVLDKFIEHVTLQNPSKSQATVNGITFVEEEITPIILTPQLAQTAPKEPMVQVMSKKEPLSEALPFEEILKEEPEVPTIEDMVFPTMDSSPKPDTVQPFTIEKVDHSKKMMILLKLLMLVITLASLCFLSFYFMLDTFVDFKTNTYSIFLKDFFTDFNEIKDMPLAILLGIMVIIAYLSGFIAVIVNLFKLMKGKAPFVLSLIFYLSVLLSYFILPQAFENPFITIKSHIAVLLIPLLGVVVTIIGLILGSIASRDSAYNEGEKVVSKNEHLPPVRKYDTVIDPTLGTTGGVLEPVIAQSKSYDDIVVPNLMTKFSEFLKKYLVFLEPFNLLIFLIMTLLLFFNFFSISDFFIGDSSKSLGLIKFYQFLIEVDKSQIYFSAVLFGGLLPLVFIVLILTGIFKSIMNMTQRKDLVKVSPNISLFLLVTLISQYIFYNSTLIPLMDSPLVTYHYNFTLILILSLVSFIANYCFSYFNADQFKPKIKLYLDIKNHLKEFMRFDQDKLFTVIKIVLLSFLLLLLNLGFYGLKDGMTSYSMYDWLGLSYTEAMVESASDSKLLVSLVILSQIFIGLTLIMILTLIITYFLSLFSNKSNRKLSLILSIIIFVSSLGSMILSLIIPQVIHGDFYEFVKDMVYTESYWILVGSIILTVFSAVLLGVENRKEVSKEAFSPSIFFETIFYDLRALLTFITYLLVFYIFCYSYIFSLIFIFIPIGTKTFKTAAKYVVPFMLLGTALLIIIFLFIVDAIAGNVEDIMVSSNIITFSVVISLCSIFILRKIKRMELIYEKN